ncbi:Fanconi anemia group J protein homolog [Mytilus edulis]|uniref:Fanconi anemia group J protein homolog n=1 Tax=Mytilus edulis TaxID=6550 RepID=UPI0039EEC3AA
MTEERRTIRGVEVIFPCKPYPSQFSFMDKVIQGCEKGQNCLLESPTGSGKSLALLCSALAWQTAEYAKKRQEESESEHLKSKECCCKQKQSTKEVLDTSEDDKVNFSTNLIIPDSNISVNVVRGQIAHQQANVIVNTTSTNLQLNYGAVSQSLLCVGGPQLQKECNQKYPDGVNIGDVAVTSGGSLKCDVIFHGALPQWKDAGALTILQTFMKNCLTTANSHGYTSIAFPALGTGSLGFPRDIVAREMFSSVQEFARDSPTSSVSDVRFVVYGGDSGTVKAFEEHKLKTINEEKIQKGTEGTTNTKSSSTIVIPESDDEDDDFKPPSIYRTPGSSRQSLSEKIKKHQSISYDAAEPGPSEMEKEEDGCCCNCGAENKQNSRKVPKIYFGTRTHKQISQIVRELKKTAYRDTRMTILASKEFTCIHPAVSKMKNKNEGCKELMDGPGCKFNDRVKKIFPHYSNLQEYGLSEAWDLEDLVHLCRQKKVCPYFSVRSFRKEIDIVFCPYNYLIDPIIRQNMEINLKDEIVILDEAHNIEDSAREGGSENFTDDQLDKAIKEIHEMIIHGIKPGEHLRLQQMVEGFMKIIQNNIDHLEQSSFDQASKVWSGYDIVVRMKEYGIGPQHKDELLKCLSAVCEDATERSVQNVRGQTVKLSSATGSTLERMFNIMDFMYRKDLKYLEDYRVAILKSTTYVSDNNTDGSWISSRNRRGGMRPVPKYVITLHFWCMNPGVAFSDLHDTRSIVLTSGTLSPMNSFESELDTPFPIKLEANHVIEDKQVWVGAMSQGPTGKPLHAVYKTMETLEFQDELGKTVLQVCQEVPHGVLCFLPSYRSLEKFIQRWKNAGIYEQISKKKKIIQEPRRSDQVDFDDLLNQFYDTIHGVNDEDDEDVGEETTGALFLAVCRGKVSEGLDFADNFARAVITVGIPYPNWKDIQVGQKRMYNDKHKMSKGLLSGSEWYEIQAFRALNQALGRCIRHRKDWGLLILADERFVKQKDKYCKGLSKWVRNKVQAFTSCKQAMESISSFSKQRMKDMPIVNPDTTFIPSTPTTPGQPISRRSGFQGASTIATPITPATPLYSIFSPITPLTKEKKVSTGTSVDALTPKGVLPKLAQPKFSTPVSKKDIPAAAESKLDKIQHRLMSPTEVKKNPELAAAAKAGGIIQAQPGHQTQIILQNPQQTTANQQIQMVLQQMVNKGQLQPGQQVIVQNPQPIVSANQSHVQPGQKLLIQNPQQAVVGGQGQTLLLPNNQETAQQGQGQQLLLQNNQQKVQQGQGQTINNQFLTSSTYQYILSVMNSPLVPKDKPYYIIVDENTPKQQMFLIQPNQGTGAQIIKTEPTVTTTAQPVVGNTTTSHQSSVPTHIQSQATKPGMVSLLNVGHSTSSNTKAEESQTVTDDLPSVSKNEPVTHATTSTSEPDLQNIKMNKLFKYCQIPESNISEKGDGELDKNKTKCPQTPTLFDTQDSEQEFKNTNQQPINRSVDTKKTSSVGNKALNQGDEACKNESESKTHKKPIFRRQSVGTSAIVIDNDSPDEFIDQSKLMRKSCDKKILTEIKQNTTLESTKKENMVIENEENESEETLNTRRKNRGAKRKSHSNLRLSAKKQKGVDFLDNLEDQKSNAIEKVIKCKGCGEALITQLEDFEKRKRYPAFVRVLTTQRTAEVIFLPTLDVKSTNLQTVSTKLEKDSDFTLDSYEDKSTGSMLQYLSCHTCTKDVIGIQVIKKGANSKDVEDKQAWLVCSLVDTSAIRL